jgi:carbon-monoxide dehydrogenase small subunit
MLVSARALLECNPAPDEAVVRSALSGNLCRCTGYVKIIAAVQSAAAALSEGAVQS